MLPKLTLNGQPFSAIESATLKVECTNTHDITATTTTAVSLFNEPILFDFIVPELRKKKKKVEFLICVR